MAPDTWDRMSSWDLVLPPSRPAAWQLDVIRTALQGCDRSAPVGILGSTPEFRDLLYEMGFTNVILLERNLAFHKRVSNLRAYESPETVLEGDWLETLPTLPGTFRVLLSDLTSGNIPYTTRGHFYHLVTESLLPNGLFIDKVLQHHDRLRPLDPLLEKYATLPLNLLHVNQFSCEVLFTSELLDPDLMVDSSRFYDLLEVLPILRPEKAGV